MDDIIDKPYHPFIIDISMDTKDIIIRIILAIFIGGFIGYEREMRNRPAGFITHTLVCVGATVVSLIQIQMVQNTIHLITKHPELGAAMKADLGRVIAQVVTGVGFLGAGTIILDKGSVKGLTTATTIWVVACIGLSIGLGYYKISIISGISVIFVVVFLKNFEAQALNRQYQMYIDINYRKETSIFIEEMLSFFRKYKVQVRDIKILESKTEEINRIRFILYFGFFGKQNKVIEELAKIEDIISFSRK